MTMKLNVKNRYRLDWDTPYETDDQPIKMNLSRKTGFEEVPTDVLRNLWLVKFSGRVVTMRDMHNHRFDDIADIGQELANRKQIRFETQSFVDRTEVTHYYILEKENADH